MLFKYVKAAINVTIQTFTSQGCAGIFFLPQADRGNKKKSNSIFNEYYAVYHWHCRSSDKNILE